jgi:hypothetical protein
MSCRYSATVAVKKSTSTSTSGLPVLTESGQCVMGTGGAQQVTVS